MNETRSARLTGLFLIVLGVTVTAVPLLFPALFGTTDNGLLVAPVIALVGVVLIYRNRPTRKGRATRSARRAA
jgi:membrane protein implicated in regulation of membrane protease activity